MEDGFGETFFTQADSRRFNMNRGVAKQAVIGSVLVLLLLAGVLPAAAAITGVTGTQFNLVARDGYVSTPDGGSVYSWGYGLGTGVMQYPGPTLIVNQGATITVTLRNELPAPAGNVSIVFPGHAAAASGGVAGKLTREAPAGGAATVSYTFTATNPGTYSYHSGTNVGLQVDMGLVGAIIVRPAGFNPASPTAYGHADSQYTYENLFLLTEMDVTIHNAVQAGVAAGVVNVDTTAFFPVTWFINGRCAPDTMLEDGVPWLPHQPYGAMVMMHPGDKVLMRLIGGGRDLHPFHHHGNNSLAIARDGKLLGSTAGAGADLAVSDFTQTVYPGSTVDAIFTWTGEKLGWDFYGHQASDPLEPGEYAPDHGKPFPVVLPGDQELTFGEQWSGSPFLGGSNALPPGAGGLNPNAGYFFMWHSHNEKEMTNFNVFPGGMMTHVVVEHPNVMLMGGN
jgi:FtsP/CotA-like multicopper oxidase with cupredoxin domain